MIYVLRLASIFDILRLVLFVHTIDKVYKCVYYPLRPGEHAAMKTMLEFVRRCPHCNRTATTTSREWDENPYCGQCIDDRLKTAARLLGPTRLVYFGDYSGPIPADEKDR